MKEKIQGLETSLTQLIKEFHGERAKLLEESRIEHDSSRNELIKLQRALELKNKEMNKVKKLGKTILEQRTEMEIFFLDALQNVKRQIVYSRLQHHKDALNAYQTRMLGTQHGQSEHSRMRTFNETFQELDTFSDLEEKSKW